MIKRRSIVPLLIAALAVTGIVRADLAVVIPTGAAMPSSDLARQGAGADLALLDALPFAFPAYEILLPGQFDPLPLDSALEPGMLEGQVCQIPPVSILSDQQDSLVLCLYGLLGFGAFRSLSCVRRFSFTIIPDWYHSGGPVQIGHSLVIAPDCQASTSVCCLVQPDPPSQDHLSDYHSGIIESLWRRSQFTPTTLAARGPPAWIQ